MKLERSHQFTEKNTQISNFVTIRPGGTEFHADGWTDMTKLIVCFRNFAKAPENELHDFNIHESVHRSMIQ